MSIFLSYSLQLSKYIFFFYFIVIYSIQWSDYYYSTTHEKYVSPQNLLSSISTHDKVLSVTCGRSTVFSKFCSFLHQDRNEILLTVLSRTYDKIYNWLCLMYLDRVCCHCFYFCQFYPITLLIAQTLPL